MNRETFEAGGNKTARGEKLLKVTMENTVMQWVTENTRQRGDDKPTRFSLTLTKGIHPTKELRRVCPLEKSNHAPMEREADGDVSEEDEAHKENRRNYGTVNTEHLMRLFEPMDWRKLKRANVVQDEHGIFMELYEAAVNIPVYKPKERGRQVWFNARSATAKKIRGQACITMKRNGNQTNKEDFKIARNKSVKIRQEEEKG